MGFFEKLFGGATSGNPGGREAGDGLATTSLSRAFVALLMGLGSLPASSAHADTPPHFIIIITDDQRYDHDLNEYMPKMWSNLVEDEGVWFTNAYVTTPLCCPSRSNIFTGMYASQTGVRANETPLDVETVAKRLKDSGYYTGLVGKYLNSWNATPRPEFDYWASFDALVYPAGVYFEYKLNINGTIVSFCSTCGPNAEYMTEELVDQSELFIQNAVNAGKPFLLILTPPNPHHPSESDVAEQGIPVDQHIDDDFVVPSINEADVSDKPQFVQQSQPADLLLYRAGARAQVRSLMSLDRHLDRLFDALQASGLWDDTVVFYISDNGYFWGEHRLGGKNPVYQEGIRVPFAMRYPPVTASSSRVRNDLVASIDIAPTIYDLAGIAAPAEVQGVSLDELLAGAIPPRTHVLIESWHPIHYAAIHTGNDRSLGADFGYVYVKNDNDTDELYDLEVDPYQLNNLISDVSYEATRFRLEDLLPPPPPSVRITSPVTGFVGRQNGFAVAGTFEARSGATVSAVEIQVYDHYCGGSGSVYGPVLADINSTDMISGTWQISIPGDLHPGCRIRLTARAKSSTGAYTQIDTEEIVIQASGQVGTGCFIATAAYGTPMSEDIKVLSRFRDEVLLENKMGRVFVDWYYRTSPFVADFIEDKPALKALTRTALEPVLFIARWTQR